MATWNTFQEMEQLRREIDGMFNSFFPTAGGLRNLVFLPGHAARRYPLVNLYEDADQFVVEAPAPGIDPEKLNISIVGNILTLSGEKLGLSKAIKADAFHRNERAAGRFIRTLELPTVVDASKVEAEYKNGIIRVTLPKAEETKPKTIKVNVN